MDPAAESNRALRAEPREMAGLVQYGEGSVVSRTLIQKDTGTVTLFAFDRDQELSEHTAPYDALVYVLDGAASIVLGGVSFTVRTGETIVMPADEPHAVKALEQFKMLLIMIRS